MDQKVFKINKRSFVSAKGANFYNSLFFIYADCLKIQDSFFILFS